MISEERMVGLFNELVDDSYNHLDRGMIKFNFFPSIGDVNFHDELNDGDSMKGVKSRLKLFAPLELFFYPKPDLVVKGLIARGLSAIVLGIEKDPFYRSKIPIIDGIYERMIDRFTLGRVGEVLVHTKEAWESYINQVGFGKVKGYSSKALKRKFG